MWCCFRYYSNMWKNHLTLVLCSVFSLYHACSNVHYIARHTKYLQFRQMLQIKSNNVILKQANGWQYLNKIFCQSFSHIGLSACSISQIVALLRKTFWIVLGPDHFPKSSISMTKPQNPDFEKWLELRTSHPTHSIFFINCIWRYTQKEIKNWIKRSCFFWQQISIIISEIIAVRYRSLLCKYLLISGVLQSFANHQLSLFSIFIIDLVLLYKKLFWLPKPLQFQSW